MNKKRFLLIVPILLAMAFVGFSCKSNVPTLPNDYISLVTQGNQWNELHSNGSLPPEYQYEHTIINKIGNDTLVNGLTYYKLLTSQDEALAEWIVNGLLREDVNEQKVYYKPKNKPELLLYAFNVRVGDVLQTYDYREWAGNLPIAITVNNIDSININNKMYKRIFITSIASDEGGGNYGENNVWIESIGGINGLLNSYLTVSTPGSDGITLSCFYKNNELIYKPNEQQECFVWGSLSNF
jgi:hypothetical protein